jgi:hypothetical protein
MNLESNKSNEGFSKRLFKKLDWLLVTDKLIDLVLIFVGLAAALALENSIENKNKTENYLNYLTKIHTEISINESCNDSHNNAIKDYFELLMDANEKIAAGVTETINGTDVLASSTPNAFHYTSFRGIESSNFLNKGLYSELLNLYTHYESMSDFVSSQEEILNLVVDDYLSMYSRNLWGYEIHVEDYIRFNASFHRLTRSMGNGQDKWKNIKFTGRRVLSSIEMELNNYGLSIEESRDYKDYYWLSFDNMYVNNALSKSYALQGIQNLEEKMKDTTNIKYPEFLSYFGRLNRNLCGVMLYGGEAIAAIQTVRDENGNENHSGDFGTILDWGENDEIIEEFNSYLSDFMMSGVYRAVAFQMGCDYFTFTSDCEGFKDFFKENWINNFEIHEIDLIIKNLHIYDCFDDTLKDIMLESPEITEFEITSALNPEKL